MTDATIAASNRFLSPMEVELAKKALAAGEATLVVAKLRTEEAEQKLDEIRILRRRADLVCWGFTATSVIAEAEAEIVTQHVPQPKRNPI